MVKKMIKYSKFILCIALILSLIAPSYAALSASDGSAFVTKAEFDSALADFNARLTTFEAGINSKIDSQVTSYLDRNGIWNGKEQTFDADFLHISWWDASEMPGFKLYSSSMADIGVYDASTIPTAKDSGVGSTLNNKKFSYIILNDVHQTVKRTVSASLTKSGLVNLVFGSRLDMFTHGYPGTKNPSVNGSAIENTYSHKLLTTAFSSHVAEWDAFCSMVDAGDSSSKMMYFTPIKADMWTWRTILVGGGENVYIKRAGVLQRVAQFPYQTIDPRSQAWYYSGGIRTQWGDGLNYRNCYFFASQGDEIVWEVELYGIGRNVANAYWVMHSEDNKQAFLLGGVLLGDQIKVY